ncbi:hypothetical protein ACWD7F_39445 [Streptomyces sp. NPDC005122]
MESPVGAAPEREQIRSTAAEPSRPPRSRHPRPPVRAWLQPAVISLVVAAAFISCYVGLQRDPQPHRVPIAVAAPVRPGAIHEALGDTVEVHPAADTDAARRASPVHR